MRYVEGTDLKTLLEREGPLEPARAIELVGQVGEALDAAHAHGLVHRDVKPANVLVTEEGGEEHCYLADFGLARTADLEAGAGTGAHLSGTVDYTAPEQIAAEPADQRADVYSLGCVLYECLAGEPPFKRPRAVATLFAHASEPPPSLHEKRPELPEAIDPVIARALAKDSGRPLRDLRRPHRAAGEALGVAAPRFSRRRLILLAVGGATRPCRGSSSSRHPARAAARRLPLRRPILPLADTRSSASTPRQTDLVAAVPLRAPSPGRHRPRIGLDRRPQGERARGARPGHQHHHAGHRSRPPADLRRNRR